jgi:hypothetical protein
MKTKTRNILLGVTIAVALCAMVACAPKETPLDTAREDTTQNDGASWALESDCIACHTAIAAVAEATLFHVGQDCRTCHIDDDGKLSQAHADAYSGLEPTRLTKTKVNKNTCLTSACHTSYNALSELTAEYAGEYNPHESHNGQLECGSCHSIHSSESVLYCANCHPDMSKPEGWK